MLDLQSLKEGDKLVLKTEYNLNDHFPGCSPIYLQPGICCTINANRLIGERLPEDEETDSCVRFECFNVSFDIGGLFRIDSNFEPVDMEKLFDYVPQNKSLISKYSFVSNSK